MFHGKVKYIGSCTYDISDEQLNSYVPYDLDDFRVDLVAWCTYVDDSETIPSDNGTDLFYPVIVSPSQLDGRADGCVIYPCVIEDLIVVKNFNFAEIERFITERVASCSGETALEVAQKIDKFAGWEFTGYDPS